ncbi:hypothetical protein ORY94_07900 [Enterococcus casseliflavus]|uniref:hypothetical protein n=1 Tax=Enterococcus casseliflavus TaxID=37734 RepID=UPI00224FD75D|nr:hypothetical protein [Enterococcus casseliflavus]MCX4167841.1 hypothetical protein [Enterococcus casseliflavus]
MKKFSIIIVSIVVIAIIITSSFSYFFDWNIKILDFLLTVFPVILFYIQFLVENQNKAFITWSKIKVYFKNPGLKWQITSYLNYSDIDISKINDIYDNILEDKDFNYYADDTPQIISKKNNVLIIQIGITQYTLTIKSNSVIKISGASNVNYKDSKTQLNDEFRYLLKQVNKTLERTPIDESYILKISFKKENPYYGILLKSLNEENISSFILKYKQNDLDFTVSKNTIETTTKSFDSLSKVTENYLVISDN